MRDLNVPLFQSWFEADLELAHYCKKNNCFAVLGRDSDFFIMDIPRYISLNLFYWKSDQIEAVIFEPENIAYQLGLQPQVTPQKNEQQVKS